MAQIKWKNYGDFDLVWSNTQNVIICVHVYLHAKNKLYQYFFLKLLEKYYHFPILGTLVMPSKNNNDNL